MKRVLRKIVTALLCIVIFISSVVGLVTMIIDDVLAPTGKIGLVVADFEYGDKMYDTVCEKLEENMALVAITMDDISDIISEDEIRRAVPEASVFLAKRLLGVSTEEWKYENEDLRALIGEKLDAYAKANDIEYKEGSADEVYEMICGTVSAELNVVTQSYVEKVSPIFAKVRSICEYWMVFIILFLVSLAVVLIIGRRHIKKAIYNVMFPTYFAAFAVYVTSAILYSKDYLAKTILKGMLQHYIRGVYNTILSDLKQVSGFFVILCIITTVLIIIAIVTDCNKKHRHHKRCVKRSGGNDPAEQVKSEGPRVELDIEEIVKINKSGPDTDPVDESDNKEE